MLERIVLSIKKKNLTQFREINNYKNLYRNGLLDTINLSLALNIQQNSILFYPRNEN